jgi:hypothetical protein
MKMENIEDASPTLWDLVNVLVAQAAQRRREGQHAAAASCERVAAWLREGLDRHERRARGMLLH